MADAIEQSGMPDLLLADEYYMLEGISLDLQSLADQEALLDLTGLLESDTEYRSEDYLDSVADAGILNGKQYLMPLSVRNDYLFLDDSAGNALTCLPSDYTLLQLQEAVYQEAAKREENACWTLLPTIYVGNYSPIAWLENFLLSTGYLSSEGEEEENFKEGIDYLRFCYQQYYSAFSDSKMTSVSFSDQHTQLRLLTYPMCQDAEGRGVMVNSFAAIGSQTQVPESAYYVMRYLMDLDASSWLYLNVNSSYNWITSTNKNVLKEIINSEMSTAYGIRAGFGSEIFTVQPLREDLAEEMVQWIDSVHYAQLMNPRLYQALSSFLPYLRGETEDYEAAYQQWENGKTIQ